MKNSIWIETLKECLAVNSFSLLLLMAAIVFGLFATKSAHTQQQKSYELTEVQKLRLQVRQKDAQLAQIQVSIAQSAFQKTIDDFNAETKAIEKENSWPETLQLNPQTLQFTEPPPPPKPAPAKP
jgi:uncharacterized protein YlxW (UPF0749 family)